MTTNDPMEKDELDALEVEPNPEKPDTDKSYEIQIDRIMYTLTENRLTGFELRQVPDPPIPPSRDLFEIVPGRPDRKVENDDRILVQDGLRFFTAPSNINPGACILALKSGGS